MDLISLVFFNHGVCVGALLMVRAHSMGKTKGDARPSQIQFQPPAVWGVFLLGVTVDGPRSVGRRICGSRQDQRGTKLSWLVPGGQLSRAITKRWPPVGCHLEAMFPPVPIPVFLFGRGKNIAFRAFGKAFVWVIRCLILFSREIEEKDRKR